MIYIFDWDGTLCDSTKKIIDAMQRAAVTVNLPVLDDHVIKDIIGLGLREAIHRLYPQIEEQQLTALTAAYSKHFLDSDHILSPMFAGAEELLHHLKDQGIHIAVATGKSRRGLDRVLSSVGLDNFFHGSRCADETASKPDPLMLYELLEEFKKNKEEAIMIGDTEFDMEMAQRAGIHRVGVSYGAHASHRLEKYEPHAIVDSLLELKTMNLKRSKHD